MAEPVHYVTAMGFETVRDDQGEPVALALDIEPRHRQLNGVCHGAVMVGLLDTMMAVQCYRAAGRRPVATVEISARFLEPVVDGRIEARARLIKVGRRLLTVEGTVTHDGSPVLIAQATFAVVGPAADGPS
jgi:uncharacterized protein (TIGR00369 family)